VDWTFSSVSEDPPHEEELEEELFEDPPHEEDSLSVELLPPHVESLLVSVFAVPHCDSPSVLDAFDSASAVVVSSVLMD
jgi:hypothetical protein